MAVDGTAGRIAFIVLTARIENATSAEDAGRTLRAKLEDSLPPMWKLEHITIIDDSGGIPKWAAMALNEPVTK